MNTIIKRMLPLAVSASLLVPTLAACTKTPGGNNDKEERVLRIATNWSYGENGEYFRQQFTEIFEYQYPNITLEFISMENTNYWGTVPEEEQEDPIDKMIRVMQEPNPPDVVVVNYDQLPRLIDQNLLAPLDPLIAKDKFDTSNIVPSVIDGIRGLSSDGNLYALAPYFSSAALAYNKDIFDQAGVPYPTDGMTWDELFDLARRVARPGDDPIYGFSFTTYTYSSIYDSSYPYTDPLQLKMFDDNVERMLVNNDQWERVWTTLVQLENEQITPPSPDVTGNWELPYDSRSPFSYNYFMSGRVAMSIVYYSDLYQIDNANRNAHNIEGYTPINYDVVTVPSHPEYPNQSSLISFEGIMAINALAGNAEDAWRFISFINGEDWARAKAKNNYQLMSRKNYNKVNELINMDAFYNIKPVERRETAITTDLYRTKPRIWEVYDIGRREFIEAAKGNKTVREALQSWETEGNVILQDMIDNPVNPGEGGDIGIMPVPRPVIIEGDVAVDLAG